MPPACPPGSPSSPRWPSCCSCGSAGGGCSGPPRLTTGTTVCRSTRGDLVTSSRRRCSSSGRSSARSCTSASSSREPLAGSEVAIRAWDRRDRADVQALLRLLSADAEVRADDAPTYVAETGGRVVGMVTLCVFRTLTGPKAYLDHLVVASDWRRRGIGRALLEYAIEQAQAGGVSRIDLTANTEK